MFHGKDIKLKTFPHGYIISLCGVVVRCSRVDHKVPGSSPTHFFLSFLPFFPIFFGFFSINIFITKCYLIKCNKQQEKYCVSRENIAHRILYIYG